MNKQFADMASKIIVILFILPYSQRKRTGFFGFGGFFCGGRGGPPGRGTWEEIFLEMVQERGGVATYRKQKGLFGARAEKRKIFLKPRHKSEDRNVVIVEGSFLPPLGTKRFAYMVSIVATRQIEKDTDATARRSAGRGGCEAYVGRRGFQITGNVLPKSRFY